MFDVFSSVSSKQIWHLYEMKFIGNETIINNKEVLKGQFSYKFPVIFNLMMFSNN